MIIFEIPYKISLLSPLSSLLTPLSSLLTPLLLYRTKEGDEEGDGEVDKEAMEDLGERVIVNKGLFHRHLQRSLVPVTVVDLLFHILLLT